MVGVNMENILQWVAEEDTERDLSVFKENLQFAREMKRCGHDRSFFDSCLVADHLGEVFPTAVEALPGVLFIDHADGDLCESWSMSFQRVTFELVVETPAQQAALDAVRSELDDAYQEYQELAKAFEDDFSGDWSDGNFSLQFRCLYEDGGGNADWAVGGEHLAMYRILRNIGELCEQVTTAMDGTQSAA